MEVAASRRIPRAHRASDLSLHTDADLDRPVRDGEVCIENDEVCIENDGFCIENHEFLHRFPAVHRPPPRSRICRINSVPETRFLTCSSSRPRLARVRTAHRPLEMS